MQNAFGIVFMTGSRKASTVTQANHQAIPTSVVQTFHMSHKLFLKCKSEKHYPFQIWVGWCSGNPCAKALCRGRETEAFSARLTSMLSVYPHPHIMQEIPVRGYGVPTAPQPHNGCHCSFLQCQLSPTLQQGVVVLSHSPARGCPFPSILILPTPRQAG